MSPDTGRAALRMPQSITRCATWMPFWAKFAGHRWARPRSANLPMAKAADSGSPSRRHWRPSAGWRPAPRYHSPGGLLGDQESPEGADLDGPFDVVGRQVDQRAAHPGAGVVARDIRRARLGLDRLEQRGNILRIGGVAFMDSGACLAGERRKLVGLAGGDGNGEP